MTLRRHSVLVFGLGALCPPAAAGDRSVLFADPTKHKLVALTLQSGGHDICRGVPAAYTQHLPLEVCQ